MLDYIEQISLKFHIERFISKHIDEQYRFQNYIIELSKCEKYLHFYIKDLSAPKEHNRINYVTLIHFYNFELFLHILKKAKEQFQKHH